ncbi:MAG TPA: chalcone isomerase family protein [Pseudomonadales bacterium]|nr:chalcone isomerase family protein [Pseudomonadales bacterium]
MRKICYLLLLLLSTPSWAIVDDLKPSGSGQLRWLLLDIYEATLYTATGNYIDGVYPKALEIHYMRNISAADLIKTTEDEWRRLNVPFTEDWLILLAQIWPDVNKGDRLTMRAESLDKASFYFNDMLLGQIEETGFAKAFLAIWLSPNSRDKQLRAQLIGDNNA